LPDIFYIKFYIKIEKENTNNYLINDITINATSPNNKTLFEFKLPKELQPNTITYANGSMTIKKNSLLTPGRWYCVERNLLTNALYLDGEQINP
jgi:hypothetical protein